MSRSSAKVRSVCKTLGKPSEAKAKVLASLFPTCAGTKRRAVEFNPDDECVAAEAHRRKRAATRGKGKAKKLKVVLLEDVPSSIPKGSQRNKLKNGGRIEEIGFHRQMGAEETRKHIQRAFCGLGCVSNFKYFQGHKDTSLKVSLRQELDGCGVIDLAGFGSLYLQQLDDPSAKEPEASSSHASSASGSRTQQLLREADELLKELHVSWCLYLLNVHYYCKL